MTHISNDDANENLEKYLKKEYPDIIINSADCDLNIKIDKKKIARYF